MRLPGNVCAALVSCVLLLGIAPAPFAESRSVVRLSPSHTRVGVAKVILNVSDLKFERDALVGSYEIRIPLAPWRNDHGEVRFDLDGPLDRLIASGGTVSGTSRSLENGQTHPIECRFLGNGSVDITVDNGKQILAFRSRVE